MAPWLQNYDPLHNTLLSTLVAALPVVVLLTSIAFFHLRIHLSALLGLVVALIVAVWGFKMPVAQAGGSALYGALFGLFPIGWIILNVLFLYQLTVQRGLFAVMRDSLARVAPDARIQLVLIAFCFGAFIEGVAGFGAPVAITGAILIQLGFKPLHASGLALIANTAPVAFGSLGIPITTLHQVADLDPLKVSAMVGRQLPFFSLVIPFWVVMAFCGWRRSLEVWPALLTAGAGFALPQFLVSNFHGPWLVDTISGACSIGATLLLLRYWKPVKPMLLSVEKEASSESQTELRGASEYAPVPVWRAWLPWVILTGFIFVWGQQGFKAWADKTWMYKVPITAVDGKVQRIPPVAPEGAKPEKAVFELKILSATGTGILLSALVAGLLMGCSAKEMAVTWVRTIWTVRFSLFTIAAMLALGNVTKFSGADATLGLALAQTGYWYPFFGTLLGWLGVALTGSDTASNVLFGSLQKITAEQTGISPILMGAANSSGGVMGKMVDAQSIVVASTATRFYGQEGAILRFVFWHSLILASLIGVLVFLQARVPWFQWMVVE